MICVDTTFLVDLWRTRDLPDPRQRDLLDANPGAEFAVPAHAAGSSWRAARRSRRSVSRSHSGFFGSSGSARSDLETAYRYATIVAELRRGSALVGRSKPDLWIAAWAVQHAAPLATRNTKHFKGIPDLELIDYSMS